MYKAKVNETEYELEKSGGDWMINGKVVEADLLPLDGNRFHLLLNNKAYHAELLDIDTENKMVTVRVNNHDLQVQLKDRYDLLLHQLGMDTKAGKKANEIKAPMPGMVLRLMVKEGDTIAKGDGLLVLEAMKMENIIKAPSDGVVKHITVAEKDKVDKNQVLIQFA